MYTTLNLMSRAANSYLEYKRACTTLEDQRCTVAKRNEYHTMPLEKLYAYKATLEDCAKRACACADKRVQYTDDFINVQKRNSGHAYQVDRATQICKQRLEYVRELVAHQKGLLANPKGDVISEASTSNSRMNRFNSLELNANANANVNSNLKNANLYDPNRNVADDWESLFDNNQAGASSAKKDKTHKRTTRKHKCIDGVTRTVYTMNKVDYVMRKDAKGACKFVKIKPS